MDDQTRAEAASVLAAAEQARQAVPPLSSTYSGLAIADAYDIQLTNVRARISAGRRIVGHKVGLTAKAMQEMLGVDEPDYGHLLDDMVVDAGVAVARERYVQPRVEIEIGFVLRDGLAGPGVTADDVMAATAYVVPSIEIIDSRIADWRITLVDTIADNASSAGIVLGLAQTSPGEIDLAAVKARLSLNGEVVASGTGADVLGHPARAVAWLANKLGEFGVQLLPGHVVLPGSCTKAIDVRAGDLVEADFDGLGTVGVAFA